MAVSDLIEVGGNIILLSRKGIVHRAKRITSRSWKFEEDDTLRDENSYPPEAVLTVMKSDNGRYWGFRCNAAEGKVLQAANGTLQLNNHNFGPWEQWSVSEGPSDTFHFVNKRFPNVTVQVGIQKVAVLSPCVIPSIERSKQQEEKINELCAIVKNLDRTKATLEEEVEKLTKKLKQTEEEKIEAHKVFSQKIEELTAVVSNLEVTITSLEADVEAVQMNLEQSDMEKSERDEIARQEMTSLGEQLAKIEEEKSKMESEIVCLIGQKKAADESAQSTIERLRSLETELAEVRAREERERAARRERDERELALAKAKEEKEAHAKEVQMKLMRTMEEMDTLRARGRAVTSNVQDVKQKGKEESAHSLTERSIATIEAAAGSLEKVKTLKQREAEMRDEMDALYTEWVLSEALTVPPELEGTGGHDSREHSVEFAAVHDEKKKAAIEIVEEAKGSENEGSDVLSGDSFADEANAHVPSEINEVSSLEILPRGPSGDFPVGTSYTDKTKSRKWASLWR